MLLKDMINLRQQVKVYFFIIAVWLAVALGNRDMSFFGSVMMVFTVLIPISAIAYDERSKWDSYALTMPVTRNDLVLSKYALAGLCALGAVVFTTVISMIVTGRVSDSIVSALGYLTAGLILPAVILPLVFKFGVEKGRLLMMAIFLIPWLLVLILPRLNLSVSLSGSLSDSVLYFIPMLAVLLLLLSVAISIRIYRNKEF